MAPSPVVRTYPLSSYSFDTKMEKHKSIINPITRLDSIYKTEGIRRIVEGILLVHEHNHPYILLLKVGTAFYKLPGGKLEAGESEINGLKRKLSSKLGPDPPSPQPDWQIGECVGVWWRTNFETSAVYPYCPPHRTKPRECRKQFVVQLPEREYFVVPKNLQLVSVPFYQLYDNAQKFGHVIASIPEQLSRFQFNTIDE
ncbi:hypothetical protein MIMGU_mgv1a019353mg [Erythranthe guttata]|uniref:Pre-mRNA cleavage factor Im 25 kDa subunit n=2 Tax=Erythranthe guttata TaxID=4155 RepID=A0A022QAW4_ERYGU|nr:hypothetical protein MIMGU_mgv1a019353mg [Erythranthe guttata]